MVIEWSACISKSDHSCHIHSFTLSVTGDYITGINGICGNTQPLNTMETGIFIIGTYGWMDDLITMSPYVVVGMRVCVYSYVSGVSAYGLDVCVCICSSLVAVCLSVCMWLCVICVYVNGCV